MEVTFVTSMPVQFLSAFGQWNLTDPCWIYGLPDVNSRSVCLHQPTSDLSSLDLEIWKIFVFMFFFLALDGLRGM